MKFIRDNVEENALVSMTIDLPDYEKALFQDGKGWVCTLNDEVVGFSCGRLKQADVWALFLDKKHEGQGIGQRLMELLESWMFSQGIDEIVLSTWPQTRAESLYRRRGWKDFGLLKNGEREFRLKKNNNT
jgi:GNAT superfamily N-acetyltransferase